MVMTPSHWTTRATRSRIIRASIRSIRPALAAADLSGARARPTLTVIGSYAETLVKYGFDGDWGNPVLWAPYIYDYTDVQNRNRNTQSLEARLGTNHEHGFNWLVGVYGLQLHESLNEDSAGIFFDPSQGGAVPPHRLRADQQPVPVADRRACLASWTANWRRSGAGLSGCAVSGGARAMRRHLNPDCSHDFHPGQQSLGWQRLR